MHFRKDEVSLSLFPTLTTLDTPRDVTASAWVSRPDPICLGNSGMHVGRVLGTVLETRLRFALLPLQFVQPDR